jgi:hypothetical protein
MPNAQITAQPDTIIVDLDSGQIEGVTGIFYNSGGHQRIALWERLVGVTNTNWMKIDLLRGRVQNTGPGVFQEGSFASLLVRPGQCYQVRMDADLNNNPNEVDITPIASVSVCALRKKTEPTNFGLKDRLEETGGTYHFYDIETNLRAHLKVAVSKIPAVTDSNGMLVFDAVEQSTEESGFDFNHTGELTPLFPGTRYFRLLRVSDQSGNWQFITSDFVTLQRKVTITFNKLHIDNDGDDLGDGEAQFFIRVKQGRDLTIIQPEIIFGNDDFSIHDGQDLDITTYVFVLGPENVTPDNAAIGVDVFGVEFDGFTEDNEYASGFADLALPTGRDQEKPGGIRQPVTKNRKAVAFKHNLGTFSFTQDFDFVTEYL